MSKKVYVDLSQQDVQDIINAYEKDIEKFNKQKEILNKIKEIINHYATENEDYSKIYNQEEKEIMELLEEI
jgi:hypothetical protein